MGILKKKELKELFAKFLATKGLWNKFFEYVNNSSDWDHGGSLDNLFEGYERDWLENAFDWDKSDEEWGAWNEIDDEWKEICSLNETS